MIFHAVCIVALWLPLSLACPSYCSCSGGRALCIEKGLTAIPTGIPVTATELNLHGNQITAILSGSFDSLTNLKSIDLSSNHITGISTGVFHHLATKLTSLKLYGNYITNVSAFAFDNLTNLVALELHSNQITAISSGSFDHLTNLMSLDLSTNYITVIAIGVFDNLVSLTKLYLFSNQITAIPIGTFRRMTNLTELHLYNNQITTIPAGAFDHLASLTSLELYTNKLTFIPTGIFDHLTNLTVLYLQDNQITSMPVGVFDHLTSLTLLDLSSNRMSAISSGAFDNLTKLTLLELSNNQITAIPAGIFDHLTSLTSLYLYLNQITAISATAFDHLNALTELFLHFNQITAIPIGTFDKLVSLQKLYLFSNQITSVPPRAFAHLESIVQILLNSNRITSFPLSASPPKHYSLCLSENPLLCCGLDATNLSVLGRFESCSARCSFPPNLADTSLKSLSPLDVPTTCPVTAAPTVPPALSPNAGGGSTLALFIVLPLLVFLLSIVTATVFFIRSVRMRHSNIVRELKQLIANESLQAEQIYMSTCESMLGSLAESTRRLDCLPVRSLSDLRLGEHIGRGNFGHVFLARDDFRTGAQIAVKILSEGSSFGASCVALLLEMRVLVMLDHPHIVRVVGAQHTTPPIFLGLEYCDGGNLQDYLRRHGCYQPPDLTELTLVWFCWQLASAMEYMHSKMLVHRDLAARNVLVLSRTLNSECSVTLKLADLGLSRPLNSSDDYYRQTSDGRVPIKWMCPTAIAMRRFSKKSDVWSYGVLVWEMYSFGQRPWEGVLATEVVLLQQHGRRLAVPAAMPKWMWAQVVDKCWHAVEVERPSFVSLLHLLSDRLEVDTCSTSPQKASLAWCADEKDC